MVENVIQIKNVIKMNVNICKNPIKNHICKKDYLWNPSTCACENDEYSESIIDDSVIICDKTIKPTKTAPINFNNKKAICKVDKIYTLLTFS